jgi:V8-like Glu-specific endopeptidase
MYKYKGIQSGRIKIPFMMAIILASGSTFAQGPVSMEPPVADSAATPSDGNGPVSIKLPAPADSAAVQSVINYWTPQRMKEATPIPMPTVKSNSFGQPQAEIRQQSELPLNAYPGFAPGWTPESKLPQPSPESRIEITPSDPNGMLKRENLISPESTTIEDNSLFKEMAGGAQPQASPPFTTPTSPTDFINYAPFNRFSWYTGTYKTFPISTIGVLFFTQGGGGHRCSASVINKSTIATAGHCVHDGSGKSTGWSSNFLFCPSYIDGTTPRGCWAWKYAFTSNQWYSSGNVDRDYACIVTATTGTTIANRVGNVTGWLGRTWNWPSRQATFAWGYPAGAPFNGNRIITCASTEWYEVNMMSDSPVNQKSKYIGCDMTGGSSGGPWWINMMVGATEFPDTDGSNITDPSQGTTAPLINGINSHKRCSTTGCATGTFTQEMGSPPFRNTTGDANESEDIFAKCFSNGGIS